AVGRPDQAWHLTTREIGDVLRAGRAKELRSRIGFDRWEPFDVAVVVAQGEEVQGLAAASGVGVGRLCFVDDPTTAQGFRPRDVVVGLRPTPKLAPLLWDASALITTGGGPAAHLFESARALAIPAITSVDLEGVLGVDLAAASGRFSIAVDGNEGRAWTMPW
ncbi:MAG: PEP-utilizing enzyme, partial [Acidimicrobiia bacterium]|nr:PEP-utilizing enzyme [Acidimicrobiia bacterium]